MYRPRVLVISEFTQLSTGYAVYCKNLLTNLQKTNKYEIAELATYCEVNDPRINNVKWKVYPVVPVDPHNLQKYHEDPQNAFGKGVLNDVLIDFKPDFVLSISDHWYVNFIEHSPFRSSFNWIHMPTVDARSQKKEWLSTYANCDGLLTYTDFSKEVLEKEGNLFSAGEAPYATSELFTPLNKAECKKSFGIAPEAKIVGFVSRNQRRKLFPDTIRYFGQYLRESKREDVLLWLHSSYPDLGGWNFQEYIINENIPNKVLLTYYCKFCNSVEARHFCGASNFCYNCKQWCMTPSNVGGLIQEPDMVRMFNSFDLYIQHANCLPAGQKVKMADGWKNIEDVKVGDLAYTHNGNYKKVLNVFKKQSSGLFKKIKVFGDYEELILTDEHEVFGVQVPSGVDRSITNRIKRGLSPSFIEAQNLKVGDYILSKIDTNVVDTEKIELYPTENFIIKDGMCRYKSSRAWRPYTIDVDNEFCRFLGLYVADGSSSKNNVVVTCNNKDSENISLCKSALGRFTKATEYKYKNRKSTSIGVCYSMLSKYLQDNCGKNDTKRLPDWTMKLPIEKTREIIRGLCMGDGHTPKDRNKLTMFSTTSKYICEQLRDMLTKCGMCFCVSKRNREKEGRKDIYNFEIRGEIIKGDFNQDGTNRCSFIHNGFLYRKIKSVEDYNLETDFVYNFEVEEDNSYCTKLCSVHNSEGAGFGALEAGACGIPVAEMNYSAMEDIVQKLDGYKIEPDAYTDEIETGCVRAAGGSNLVKILNDFFNLPEEYRRIKGKKTRDNFVKWYSWDKTVRRWMNVIDNTPIKGWKNAELLLPVQFNPMEHLTNYEYARWLILNVLRDTSKLGTQLEVDIVTNLNYGCIFGQGKTQPFSREDAYNNMLNMRNYWNYYLEKNNAVNC